MYKTLTREELCKLVNFPKEKEVDSVIVYGTSPTKRDEKIKILNKVLSEFSNVKKEHNIQNDFFSTIYEFQIGNKLIWFDLVYGGAYLSELLHLACMLGSKKNFLIGSCGGLQKNLKSGEIVIPRYAYGNESSTRIYQPKIKNNKHYADEKLRNTLLHEFKDYKVHDGAIITCQAMLGETEEDIKRWSEKGYLGIDMESSTLFAVSNSFNVPSIALLHISDNLVNNVLYGSEDFESNKKYMKELDIIKFEKIVENIIKK